MDECKPLTPGKEYLLRMSYVEIYNEVINDLLDPASGALRLREAAAYTRPLLSST